jgi:hypothetical protein
MFVFFHFDMQSMEGGLHREGGLHICSCTICERDSVCCECRYRARCFWHQTWLWAFLAVPLT